MVEAGVSDKLIAWHREIGRRHLAGVITDRESLQLAFVADYGTVVSVEGVIDFNDERRDAWAMPVLLELLSNEAQAGSKAIQLEIRPGLIKIVGDNEDGDVQGLAARLNAVQTRKDVFSTKRDTGVNFGLGVISSREVAQKHCGYLIYYPDEMGHLVTMLSW